MESHRAGFPSFPHSLEIPAGLPHSHGRDGGIWNWEQEKRHWVLSMKGTRRSQMGTRQTSRLRIALIGGLTVSTMTVLCLAFLLYPAIRAHYLFSRMESLQLGHSTFDDAERLARKIGAHSYGPCDRSACEWEVRWAIQDFRDGGEVQAKCLLWHSM